MDDSTYDYIREKHKGQYRKDGNTPYIKHPVNVAVCVAKVTKDEDLFKAALLHDVVEDTDTSIDEIRGRFGSEIASIVEELTKDKQERESLKLGKKEYTLYRMARMSNDALTVKLCDRLENIKDLKNQPDEDFTSTYVSNTLYILNNLEPEREKNGKETLNIHKQLIKEIQDETGQYGTDSHE